MALVMALPAVSAVARDPDMLPSAHHEAARIMSAELSMTQALTQLKALAAQAPPTAPVDRIRYDLAVAAAGYAYRNAAREEEFAPARAVVAPDSSWSGNLPASGKTPTIRKGS